MDDPDELRRLYHEEKKSLGEIGDMFGVSDSTIMNRMNEYGIERRPRGCRPEGAGPYANEEWLREKLEKLKPEELADELDMSTPAIYYYTNKFNIKPSEIYRGQ